MPASGEGRLLGSLLRDSDMLKNLTKFAGYDFGDDPTQLVKIDGQQLRIFGKLFGMEPTVGVSFGLPGGNHGAVGGYAPHLNPHLGVNPYQDGIPLGPISINPLVSFQKGKDKHKTKIFRPLVNLHITPNLGVLKGIKRLLGKGDKFGWGAPEYHYGHGHGYGHGWGHNSVEYVPVPIPHPVEIPVPVQILGHHQVKHHHDHYHATGGLSTSVGGWSEGSGATVISNPPYGYSSPYPSSGYSTGSSSSSLVGTPYYSYGTPTPTSGFSSLGGYGGYTKFDKIGAANNGLKTTNSGSSSGGIFSGIRDGISSLIDTVSGVAGGGGGSTSGVSSPIRNQASGLTSNEESLLNTLLKEEGISDSSGDIDALTNSRFRSIMQDRIPGDSYSTNSNYNSNWGTNSVRGSRKLNTNNQNTNLPGPAHTRLPPNIHTHSASSSLITFPDETRDQNSGHNVMSFNNNNEPTSRVTFPDEGKTTRRRRRRDTLTDDENNVTTTDLESDATTETNSTTTDVQPRNYGAQVTHDSQRK